MTTVKKITASGDRVMSDVLSTSEAVHLISCRMGQLNNGAVSKLKITPPANTYTTAVLELVAGVLTGFIVSRVSCATTNTYEYWYVTELKHKHFTKDIEELKKHTYEVIDA